MTLFHKLALPLTLLFTLIISGCSGDDAPPPPTIVISGTITSAADSTILIGNAQVSLLNIQTQQNEVDPVYSNAAGLYTFTVPPGSYEVRVAAQGYEPSPPNGIAGIPVTDTSTYDVALEALAPGAYGSLDLSLVGYIETDGALVILTDPVTGDSYTGVTSIAGDVTMYNIPVLAVAYDITVKSLGHDTYTSLASVTFIDGAVTTINDITLAAITGFNVSGTVTFLGVNNGEVDVSLTDMVTGAVIPGTNVNTLGTNYSISSVAPGDYYIRATYKIDGFVVDPDAIVKFGEPKVTVVAADVTDGNINVTGAVTLTSPVVPADGSPVEVDTLTPTLVWTAYASTSDYVVEVRDANGNVVWGGFDGSLNKVVNPTATSILYAGTPLENGKIYRWKIYASKDANSATPPWSLISASEEAQGIFKVVLP